MPEDATRLPVQATDLRIAQIAAPGSFGGLERVLLGLVSALSDASVSVLPILILEPDAADPDWVQSWRRKGIEPEMIRLTAREYARERRAVRRLLIDRGVNVVHTHGYRPDVLHGGRFGHGICSVSTVHGFTGVGKKGLVYEWVQRRALRGFDGVIAVSAPLKRNLIASGIRADTVQLIPNVLAGGSATRLDRAAARARLGLPADKAVVGWVGRLSHEKGPDLLLRAALELADLDVVFAVVGDGPLRHSLAARAAAEGLADRFLLLGAWPDAAGLMSAFDLLVLSSRTEGTPMVLLEAAQSGVPFLATAVGGVPELTGDAEGVLVPPEQPEALAASIRRAFDGNSGFREASARVRDRISRRQSVDAWVTAHLDVYISALQAR